MKDNLKDASFRGKELAEHICHLILEKKGNNVLIQDLRGISSAADFFVICTTDSDVQSKAITDHIKDQLIYQSIKPWHIEGLRAKSWILLDFIDVVVHIFTSESRDYYGLERLWGDAKMIEIKDDNDSAGIRKEKH